jgi:hypothetical protein
VSTVWHERYSRVQAAACQGHNRPDYFVLEENFNKATKVCKIGALSWGLVVMMMFILGALCRRGNKKLSACRGEGSVVGLQLRVRFVPAALLAMLRTALALQCVSKAGDWTSHVVR